MGLVYVFTGKGKGKTSAAFGTAMRFLGYGKRVVVVQFLKGRESGEILLRKDLRNLDVVQFGGEHFVDLKNPSPKDMERAKEAMFYARRVTQRVDRPDLLVLDEVNVAISSGIIKETEVIELIRKLPDKTNLIITGRGATKNIMEKADLVTEMRDVKHPFAAGKKAEKGLEY
ncbi:MAG: cob(I)yrinic acid a,c-diamide adenosyltransferase [Candidatus Aenigmarchaeota archaeon]|nr:cob(I)yrinic acid a,c-diamide adenosyltransferase [Candidatus Aenigmarchaeota archaeon]NIQ18048.1 cob(I)yrinic acid a,c-diamide adenosyltransferase [Candidatus Aenigmarchaeota archaeon]